MPTGDTGTDGDNLEKPSAAKAVHGNDHGIQSWEISGGPAPEAPVATEVAKQEEPEVDEFGLPVKPPRRRPEEDISEDEFHEATNGTQEKTSSRPSSISDHIGEQEQAKESIPADAPPDQLKPPSTGTQDSIHDNRVTPLSEAAIPNNTTVPAASGVSGWSHQALAPRREEKVDHHEIDKWQEMPAFAQYDLYDDDGRMIAREARDSDDEANAYTGLGGAGKGYTRVQIDEDAMSATSMDENTNYLFKPKEGEVVEDDDVQRDPLAQMQATKDLLTEGQRIAYVGVTRLAMATMVKELEDIEGTKGTKKELRLAVESMKMWSQQMMVRLYSHMEIDSSGMSILYCLCPNDGAD